jgi:murein DD-endopeptidase MepM/ murein hydrolase activator NlpD
MALVPVLFVPLLLLALAASPVAPVLSPAGSIALAAPVGEGGCGWQIPVAGAVIDPFRQPAQPYGPGNRGLEYGVDAGTEVVAVAPGRVTFAGVVAGARYVVVSHRSGLRSTYGPLTVSLVVGGQAVVGGQPIARAAGGFHLTARAGERYVDPQPLLDGNCGRARLVGPWGSLGPGLH